MKTVGYSSVIYVERNVLPWNKKIKKKLVIQLPN